MSRDVPHVPVGVNFLKQRRRPARTSLHTHPLLLVAPLAFAMVSMAVAGLAALSGTASGYLAGSFLHATKNAPSQLLAEALGLSKTASAVILVVPAVLLITYNLVVVNRTGSAGQSQQDFLTNFANLIFGVSAVLGYFLGAAVADQAGWRGLLGVSVALCLVPAIECWGMMSFYRRRSTKKP